MNILTIKNVALGLALTATAICAKAQKTYTEGSALYNVSVNGQEVETTVFFKGDSSSNSNQRGPATVKFIATASFDYFAVLVDVPVASMKKAAVMTPGEIEEYQDKAPSYTFTPTAETKKIGDFNCKKVIAKDSKSGNSVDVWVTNDIAMPVNFVSSLYKAAGGVPVQFQITQMGVTQSLTLKSVSDAKVAAGTFAISKDYDRISMSDLQAMGGRKQ